MKAAEGAHDSGAARAVMSCLVEYLDGAVAAVDPDRVAAVQAHGGVAATDDGGDAEFAATIAAWDSGAPTSVTTAAARGNPGGTRNPARARRASEAPLPPTTPGTAPGSSRAITSGT